MDRAVESRHGRSALGRTLGWDLEWDLGPSRDLGPTPGPTLQKIWSRNGVRVQRVASQSAAICFR